MKQQVSIQQKMRESAFVFRFKLPSQNELLKDRHFSKDYCFRKDILVETF